MQILSLVTMFTLLVLPALTMSAQLVEAEEQSIQERCFTALKQNMSEVGVFGDGVEYLEKVTYPDLEVQFSEKYKTLSSFGSPIVIDEPRFVTRLHSFGEQTGYIHPPQTFFPDSQKSEVWSAPAKQNIIGEEFIIDSLGVEHFISCFFVRMTANDLQAVTADRYMGDGPGLSLMKVSSDQSYKAWYASTPSFDRAMLPLVNWEKMFIYPQVANNSYFNKYAVAEAYPAFRVDNFSFLSPLSPQITADAAIAGGRGELVSEDQNRLPATSSESVAGPEKYPLAQYFEAVKKLFPEFASDLSIRGVVSYDTFKEIITNPNAEMAKFLNIAFVSPELSTYFLHKNTPVNGVESFANSELDRLLLLVQNGEWTVNKIKEGASLDTLVYESSETVINPTLPTTAQTQGQLSFVQRYLLAISVGSVLLISMLLLWSFRKKVI